MKENPKYASQKQARKILEKYSEAGKGKRRRTQRA